VGEFPLHRCGERLVAELRGIRRGKGRKDRLAYLTNGGAQALAAWMTVRGDTVGSLCHPVNKGGRVLPRRLTDQVVLRLLRRRATDAGVAGCSPHDLRRTFIGDLLDRCADIATVKHLAGHANVTTTARYDRRGEVTKQRAAGLLHVPFVPQRMPRGER